MRKKLPSLSPGGLQQRNSEGVDKGRDRVEREQDSHAAPLPPLEVLSQLDHLPGHLLLIIVTSKNASFRQVFGKIVIVPGRRKVFLVLANL